jgi:hypothetical protein
MTFKFRLTNKTLKFRRSVTNDSKNTTIFHFFLFINDFLFFVRDIKIISLNVYRICRYSFSSFMFNRRYCVDASIISKEFRLNKKFALKHYDVHRVFYVFSNFDRVFFDMLTTIKRRKRDKISSEVNKFFDIDFFSRFALSFDLQIHLERDFDWYWYMI